MTLTNESLALVEELTIGRCVDLLCKEVNASSCKMDRGAAFAEAARMLRELASNYPFVPKPDPPRPIAPEDNLREHMVTQKHDGGWLVGLVFENETSGQSTMGAVLDLVSAFRRRGAE